MYSQIGSPEVGTWRIRSGYTRQMCCSDWWRRARCSRSLCVCVYVSRRVTLRLWSWGCGRGKESLRKRTGVTNAIWQHNIKQLTRRSYHVVSEWCSVRFRQYKVSEWCIWYVCSRGLTRPPLHSWQMLHRVFRHCLRPPVETCSLFTTNDPGDAKDLGSIWRATYIYVSTRT